MKSAKSPKCYPMCPHCGKLFKRHSLSSLTPEHEDDQTGMKCEGSQQIPRSQLTDGRILWNGQRNHHFRG